MFTADDIKYMQRALDLASRATGNTSPNPMVGAVIVSGGRIIGEGYHTRAGMPHAEPVAINSVEEKHLLRDSVMYVNLEPCSHTGRTPPCASRIIEEGIPGVVIGVKDPSEKVGGRGIEMMREAGIRVDTGLLEDESRLLNKRFFTYHEKKRPYIILKWAQSNDGYLDRLRLNAERGPNWITGMEERILVHKWRSQEDAILIGDKTACNDDPGLNVRLWSGKSPRRFVLSESSELPEDLRIFRGSPATVIFAIDGQGTNKGADYERLTGREDALKEIMEYMYREEIQSLIVEGGYKVLSQFIDAGLWDEARIFKGNIVFSSGLKAPALDGVLISETEYKDSLLEQWMPQD